MSPGVISSRRKAGATTNGDLRVKGRRKRKKKSRNSREEGCRRRLTVERGDCRKSLRGSTSK